MPCIKVAQAGRPRPWCTKGVGICRFGSAQSKYDHGMVVVYDPKLDSIKVTNEFLFAHCGKEKIQIFFNQTELVRFLGL